MDPARFERIMRLQDPDDVLRESQIMLTETADVDEKASLLVNILSSYCKLDRLQEARQALEEIKRLEISHLGIRLNAEFCEPALLVQEDRHEEALAVFAEMLDRNHDAFQNPEYRYLYEDIQCRRASVLVTLSRFKEALPILSEAAYFSFDHADDEQRTRYRLGLCLYHTNDTTAAKDQFLRVVRLGLRNDYEERSLYFLGLIHYRSGALAQALQHLETILRDFPDESDAFDALPRRWVYEMLSKTFHYLGDSANEKLYANLAGKDE